MKKTILNLILTTTLALSGGVQAQVPSTMSYQGQVFSNGQPFDGVGEFKFALVSADGTQSLWSNDDTSMGGGEPVDSVVLNVVDGLFVLALGDTNLPNMVEIPSKIFAENGVHLRLWFDDGMNGWDMLTPDQPIHAVGYAMMAERVAPGAIASGNILPGAIDDSHIADGAVGESELADGSVTTPKLADEAVTGPKIAPEAIQSVHIENNSVTSADVADQLTLETLNLGGLPWDGTLKLFSKPNGGGGGIANASGNPRGYLSGYDLGSDLSLLMGNGMTGAVVSSVSPGGQIRLWDGVGQLTAFMGAGVGGGDLNLFQVNGNPGVKLNGDKGSYSNQGSAGGEITVHNPGGFVNLLLDGHFNNAGRIELRQGDNIPYVDLFGRGANDGGEIRVKSNRRGNTVEILGAATGASGGQIKLRTEAGWDTFQANADHGADGGGLLQLRQRDGDVGAVLYATSAAGAGALSLRDQDGDPRLRLYGGPDAGSMVIYNEAGEVNVWAYSYENEEGVVSVRNKVGSETIYLWGRDSADSNGGQIGLKDADGTETLTLQASEVADNGAQIVLRKGDGTATIVLDADQGGEGRIRTQVLEITGGADLAEQFDVSNDAGVEPQPGMLVSIDSERPGQLVMSSTAYDRTAAGVISGAGGVQPGMRMGQAGSIADGSYPVALTGRVYCYVDAGEGAIQPGDLITTSNTPGHGMKVSDHVRAQGAIIGKAMTRLDSGKGLVLVLVSLQ